MSLTCTFTFCSHVVIYNGVDGVGLDGSNAYLTANLEFVSLEYLLAKNQQVDLCDESWITPIDNYGGGDDDGGDGGGRRLEEDANNEDANNEDANNEDADNENANNGDAQCDLADGYYAFSRSYTLPDYEDNMSWFATGWRGTGYIKMYSDDSSMDESLIGLCTFKFDTMVTQKSGGGMTPPTAAMTLGIIAGVFALVGLLCCYLSCCRGKKKTAAGPSDMTVGTYKRTEDDGTFISSKGGSTAPGSKV